MTDTPRPASDPTHSSPGVDATIHAILEKARAKERDFADHQRNYDEGQARFRRAHAAWQAVQTYKGDAIPDSVTGPTLHRCYAERIVALGRVLKSDGWQARLDAVKSDSDAKTYALTMLRRAMEGDIDTVTTLVREAINTMPYLGLWADNWLREGLMYEVLNIQPAPEPPLGWEGQYLESVDTVDDFIRWTDQEFLVQELINRGQAATPSDGRLVRNAFRLVQKLDLAGMPDEHLGPFTLETELAILRNLRRICTSHRNNPATAPAAPLTTEGPEDDRADNDRRIADQNEAVVEASHAVSEQPEAGESADAELQERENDILRALLMLKAESNRRSVSRSRAAIKVDPACKPSSYNKAVASLVAKGLVKSKKGPNGGIWLTPDGVSAAKAVGSTSG
jgi:hypothetical protein